MRITHDQLEQIACIGSLQPTQPVPWFGPSNTNYHVVEQCPWQAMYSSVTLLLCRSLNRKYTILDANLHVLVKLFFEFSFGPLTVTMFPFVTSMVTPLGRLIRHFLL